MLRFQHVGFVVPSWHRHGCRGTHTLPVYASWGLTVIQHTQVLICVWWACCGRHFSHSFLVFTPPSHPLSSWLCLLVSLCFWGVPLCQALLFPLLFVLYFFDEPVSARQASSSPLIGWSMGCVFFLPASVAGVSGSINQVKPEEPLSLDQGTVLMLT